MELQKEILMLKETVPLENQEQVRKDLSNKQEELEKLKLQEELSFFLRNQARLKGEIEEIEKSWLSYQKKQSLGKCSIV